MITRALECESEAIPVSADFGEEVATYDVIAPFAVTTFYQSTTVFAIPNLQ
jgi:hypothetical protein